MLMNIRGQGWAELAQLGAALIKMLLSTLLSALSVD